MHGVGQKRLQQNDVFRMSAIVTTTPSVILPFLSLNTVVFNCACDAHACDMRRHDDDSLMMSQTSEMRDVMD